MKQENPQVSQPFSLYSTPQVAELLHSQGLSLAISTYQAGKLIFISAPTPEKLIQLPRSFMKPMGIGLSKDGQSMALATREEVLVFRNSRELAYHYPKKKATYDAMFMPRASYYTNALDIHDLDWIGDDLVAVNTLFSCVMKLSDKFSFEPIWKPDFIDHIAAEDRCHLNGMAISEGKLCYATAFSKTNTRMAWKEKIPDSGVLIDIEKDEIIAEGLSMPHSPKIYRDKLYLLLSATGQLVEVSRADGSQNEIRKIAGFVRGMAFENDYVYIAHSRLRKSSSSFGKLQLPYEKTKAGITILHLPTGALVGEIRYEQSVDEIYDIRVLKNVVRPNILNNLKEDHKLGLSTPDSTFWGQPRTE